jgi:hypothetical protein
MLSTKVMAIDLNSPFQLKKSAKGFFLTLYMPWHQVDSITKMLIVIYCYENKIQFPQTIQTQEFPHPSDPMPPHDQTLRALSRFTKNPGELQDQNTKRWILEKMKHILTLIPSANMNHLDGRSPNGSWEMYPKIYWDNRIGLNIVDRVTLTESLNSLIKILEESDHHTTAPLRKLKPGEQVKEFRPPVKKQPQPNSALSRSPLATTPAYPQQQYQQQYQPGIWGPPAWSSSASHNSGWQ